MTKDSKEMLCSAAGLFFFYPFAVLIGRTFNYITGEGFTVVHGVMFFSVLLSIVINILFWWAIANSWTKED